MAWTRVDHIGVGFADADSGGAGHNVTLPGGGTAAANSLDVIAIGSNTVVNSLAGLGFASGGSRVVNQGGYLWWRINAGGEGPTVNIKTSGNENTVVFYERWSTTSGFDRSAYTGVDGSGASANPTLSSGALAQTGELLLAFVTMTDPNAGVQPTGPSWDSGMTAGDSATSSVGATTTWAAGFSSYHTNAGTAAVSPVCTWTTSAERNRYVGLIAFKASTGTDVNVADVPSGMRLGSSPASVVTDVVISDSPSGIRLGQSPSTVSVGVTATDNPSGMRLGASPASVTTAIVVSDSPSGMRLGTSSALVSFGINVSDTPSGMRLGASPIVGVSIDSGATDASPSGMRLGQSTATVSADVVVVDASHAGMRLGESPAVVGTAVFAGDVPSGMRLGQSTATVVVDVRVADPPGGLRLGLSPATVAVSTSVLDTPSGIRLGLSPATVTVGTVSGVTVADQPSGMRLGQSSAQVIVSIPTPVVPTIFVTVGLPTIEARPQPFVFDPSVGVNVHAIVGSSIIQASPD